MANDPVIVCVLHDLPTIVPGSMVVTFSLGTLVYLASISPAFLYDPLMLTAAELSKRLAITLTF